MSPDLLHALMLFAGAPFALVFLAVSAVNQALRKLQCWTCCLCYDHKTLEEQRMLLTQKGHALHSIPSHSSRIHPYG